MATMNDFHALKPGTITTPNINKMNGILPLVIRHILNSGSTIKLFDKEYDMVTIVGIIRSIDYSPTKIIFRLEDHSGQIDALQWVTDELAENLPVYFIQEYAKVIGSVHVLKGTKFMIIYHIERVLSPNIVTTHLLEMFNTRCMAEKLFNMQGHGSGMSAEAGPSTSRGSSQTWVAPTNIYRAVYKAIKRDESRHGISRAELLTRLPITDAQLKNIIDYLMNEGSVVSLEMEHFLGL